MAFLGAKEKRGPADERWGSPSRCYSRVVGTLPFAKSAERNVTVLYCSNALAARRVVLVLEYVTISYSLFHEIFGNPSFQPLTRRREAPQLSHTEAKKRIQGTGPKSSHILEWLTS